jgi:hypothetical protein
MKKSHWSVYLAVIVIVAAGVYIFTRKTAVAPVTPPANNGNSKPPVAEQPFKDLIRVVSPATGETVGSPLVVSGIARGSWYFEASFPVRLLDAAGKVLAEAPAAAQGGWMTENFVPFVVTLDLDASSVKEGKLILANDNPSGLPENDKSIELPLKFAAAKTGVKVFFGRPVEGDMETECEHVVAVGRTIDKTEAVARAALLELFNGPTAMEKEFGYITSINPGVVIQKLTIENKVAKVDLSKELERAVGGSCRVAAIAAQIRETLKQFPTVESVVISIDGRTEDILQP